MLLQLQKFSIQTTIFSVIIFLAACTDSGAGSEQITKIEDKSSASGAPAVLFLGDSLTAGRGVRLSESYPSLITAKLKAAGLKYRVINGGRSGDTTAGGLTRLSYYLRKDLKIKILVIGLGSNDAMRGVPLSEMKKNLKAIVARTRAFDPKIKIYLFQMHTFPSMGVKYSKAYGQLFPAVAKSTKITLLPFPLDGVAGKPELNQADGIHPTAKGTEIVAGNVWRGLKGEF